MMVHDIAQCVCGEESLNLLHPDVCGRPFDPMSRWFSPFAVCVCVQTRSDLACMRMHKQADLSLNLTFIALCIREPLLAERSNCVRRHRRCPSRR